MLWSGMKRYHLELMLSSWTTCYHLGWNVIIWDTMLSPGANVIIWGKMLSSGANVIIWCYHVMLSSGMIIHPFLFFLKTSLTQYRQTDRGIIKIRSQTHECRNLERGRPVSFLGIFVSNFLCSALPKATGLQAHFLALTSPGFITLWPRRFVHWESFFKIFVYF